MSDDTIPFIMSGSETILAIFKNKDRVPITPGLLLMAAYLQFVVPKEAKLIDFPGYGLDMSIFSIRLWDKNNWDRAHPDAALFRRIRNAIAHAEVSIDATDALVLKNTHPTTHNLVFEAAVSMPAFGNFLKDAMVKWMAETIKQANPSPS